jgi:phosphoribosylamine--glycine ligase
MQKTILVIGSGAREHALAWKLAGSSDVREVLVAPGNAGTAMEPGVTNVPVAADDLDALQALAVERGVDLTVVGPEGPLVDGIVDRFQAAGLRCFGPTAGAARLEGSKAFTKDFMARHNIPTAEYASFTDTQAAQRYIRERGAPIVVKADGLAAGKGVIVATSVEQAEAAVSDMLEANAFGDAGHVVVVEEFLAGEEASFIAMVDGDTILPLASSQDHKARDEGDQGPNTGGMGAYSPAPVLTDSVAQQVMNDVMRPVVDGMKADGYPYCGFLYAGLMIDPDGNPKVLEFNCRFGDPETQPVLFRLRSDLVELIELALDGRLEDARTVWDTRTALGVVMAAGGYPAGYDKGDVISGLDRRLPEDQKVFHAGTALENERVVTAGGRVLCAVALGDSVTDAQAAAYELVDSISWQNAYCRRDIGYRAVARET